MASKHTGETTVFWDTEQEAGLLRALHSPRWARWLMVRLSRWGHPGESRIGKVEVGEEIGWGEWEQEAGRRAGFGGPGGGEQGFFCVQAVGSLGSLVFSSSFSCTELWGIPSLSLPSALQGFGPLRAFEDISLLPSPTGNGRPHSFHRGLCFWIPRGRIVGNPSAPPCTCPRPLQRVLNSSLALRGILTVLQI